MEWLLQHRWVAGLTLVGGGVFSALVLLDLFAGVWLPFPWSLILLASCAAMSAGVALHFFNAAQAEKDPSGEERA